MVESGSVSLMAVNYANSTFVAVGNGKIRTSTDGITWTDTGDSTGGNEVTYGNNTHVVVGGSNSSGYSTDGISWTHKRISGLGENLESIFYKE